MVPLCPSSQIVDGIRTMQPARGRECSVRGRRGIPLKPPMSNLGMQPSRRAKAQGPALHAWTAIGLAMALGLLTPGLASAETDASQDSPETAVRAAYAELSALLWAPRSKDRDDEVGKLLARNIDFEEMTRRAFGEPCPRSGCTDHWAELSAEQRAEVEPLFAAVVTRQWTRELAKASEYDLDLEPAVTHGRDARVRVITRPKNDPSKTPLVLDTFFFAHQPPYRLVDIDKEGSRLSRTYYKQFDRTLTAPGEGYLSLVARLRKKLERGANAREGDADAETATEPPETDAAAPADKPPLEAAPKPQAAGFPWLPVTLVGAATLALGVFLGRRGRKPN